MSAAKFLTEFRSADIRLGKPLNSAHLSFSDNIRRFDVKLEKPMDARLRESIRTGDDSPRGGSL